MCKKLQKKQKIKIILEISIKNKKITTKNLKKYYKKEQQGET